MSASDLEIICVYAARCLQSKFSKHSMMSGSLIISLFRVYLRETVELYSNIFVSIAKKLQSSIYVITVLEFHANLGIIRIEYYCPAVDLIISQFWVDLR